MMAGIMINRQAVCIGHDFEGMTLNYFWNFLLQEYIPAHECELSEDEIIQIKDEIENKKDHIYIIETDPVSGKKRLKWSFIYAKSFFMFSNRSKYEFNGL